MLPTSQIRQRGHQHRPARTRLPKPRLTLAAMLGLVLLPVLLLTIWLSARSALPGMDRGHDYLREPAIGDSQIEATQLCRAKLLDMGVPSSGETATRWQIYDRLSSEILEKGLQIEGTQGVTVSSMFRRESGQLVPILKKLDLPVRAIVFRFTDTKAQQLLTGAVEQHLRPLATPAGMWEQDSTLYHSTVYHASPHQYPVVAEPQEVEVELLSIRRVAEALCPLEVVLARVVSSSTGVVMATWQVLGGSDPVDVRQALASALPRAPPPAQQTVREPSILHTTLARLVEPPASSNAARSLLDATAAMTNLLCGLRTTLDALWFVEEEQLLALALGGQHADTEIPLQCNAVAP
mmetsp:Transcript_29348/g.82770  ORF Transcript_29348/g.82770 Transcript_29348/m.82770 type:complete len:351 (-) Transcript_29348:436-1488(-)